MADNEYMGFLEPMRMSDGKGLGRIRVLGMKRGKQWIVLNDDDVREEVGQTLRVFLTHLEEGWLQEYGLLVKFRIQENDKDTDREDYDSYIVKKSPSPPIRRIGCLLLPYEGEACRDSVQSALDSLHEVFDQVDWRYAFRFYFWKEDNEFSRLIGPFENKPLKNGLQLKEQTQSFPFLNDEEIIEYNGQSYLLNEPTNDATEVIDLGTNKERATWFRNKVKKLAGNSDFLQKLDGLGPSWRGDFRRLIKDQRKNDLPLDRVRWIDVQEILDHTCFEHGELLRLKDSPIFDSFVKRAIESERQMLLKPAIDAFQKEKAELDEQIALLKHMQEKSKDDICEKEGRRSKLESELKALQDRYKEFRQEVLQDFLVYQNLFEGSHTLPGVQHGPADLIPPAGGSAYPTGNQFSKIPTQVKLPDLETFSSPVEDSQSFVTEHLFPIAQKWDERISKKNAQQLHLALLACKMVLLPNAAMIRAYHEAIGLASVYRVVTVKPTWLSFEEAWVDAIGEIWQLAKDHSNRLVFLYLQDMNRALVEMWLRPIMDLASGVRESLPTVEGPWPDNLRLVFTEVIDKGGLNVTPFALAHFARLKEPTHTKHPVAVEIPGNVAAVVWKGWTKPETLPDENPEFDDFPFELRRMAKEEWQRLMGLALKHDVDDPEGFAKRLRLRIDRVCP